MIKNYLLHLKDGNRIFSEYELIQNAKYQEKAGYNPRYHYRDFKTGKIDNKAGFLVFSTIQDGAGIVIKDESGKHHIVTGWQGDFIYI